MRAKIKAGGHASPYRLRKQLPEPVFGTDQTGTRIPPLPAARLRERTRRVGDRLHPEARPMPGARYGAQRLAGVKAILCGVFLVGASFAASATESEECPIYPPDANASNVGSALQELKFIPPGEPTNAPFGGFRRLN
jgi:hypothetical protein